MQKSFSKTLDISKIYDISNALTIGRGDNVKLTFTFKDGDDTFDISNATKARLYAKRINENGFVDPEDSPLFAKEITLSQPANVEFNVETSSTAGNAGEYLLTCLLLSADDSTITAQSMPLEVFENGYSGVYTPDQDFRDDCMEALTKAQAAATAAAKALEDGTKLYNKGIQEGNAILEDCNNAKTAAISAQSNAAQSENSAQQFKNEAEASAQVAASSAESASTILQQTQQAKDQAQSAAEIAVSTDVGSLMLDKVPVSYFHIPSTGGCFKNTTTTFGSTPVRSMCLTMHFDEDFSVEEWQSSAQINIIGDLGYANSLYNGICLRMTADGRLYLLGGRNISGNVNLTLRNYFPTFFGGTSNKVIPAGTYAFVMTVAMNEESTFSQIFVNAALKDSNTMTTINTTNFNAGTGFDVCTTGNFHGTTFTNGCFSGQLSRIMAFNFDMSAENAPYSIADYQTNKPVPPELCDPSATNKALVYFDDYTFNNKVFDISGNGNTATVTGTVKGDRDQSVKQMYDAFAYQYKQDNPTA